MLLGRFGGFGYLQSHGFLVETRFRLSWVGSGFAGVGLGLCAGDGVLSAKLVSSDFRIGVSALVWLSAEVKLVTRCAGVSVGSVPVVAWCA